MKAETVWAIVLLIGGLIEIGVLINVLADAKRSRYWIMKWTDLANRQMREALDRLEDTVRRSVEAEQRLQELSGKEGQTCQENGKVSGK